MKTLWVPGRDIELHEEYPVPEPAALLEDWQSYAAGEVVEAPGVFGALRQPDSPPRAYVSVDVCEVLRQTHLGLRTVTEVEETYTDSIHAYGKGTPITSRIDITSVLQVLMANGLIAPVEGIEQIADIMRGWRRQGAYVVANTSTLPGCEPGTIEFFRTYLPEAMDGMVLPRNHDGSLPFTKGHAAVSVIKALSPSSDITAVHIDDAPYHNEAFRGQVGQLQNADVATFQPVYPSHLPVDAGSVLAESPLEAFRAADGFLAAAMMAT